MSDGQSRSLFNVLNFDSSFGKPFGNLYGLFPTFIYILEILKRVWAYFLYRILCGSGYLAQL